LLRERAGAKESRRAAAEASKAERRVTLIAVTYQRELSTFGRLSYPLIALWQRGKP
jgi:hypothetical protein